MTPLPIQPLTDRKDLETLISHQADTPCLRAGYEADSVMAFLMQLYAYICAAFNEDSELTRDSVQSLQGGTSALKAHLMSTGRYQVVVYVTDFRARPHALRLRQRPAIYRGASMGTWIILWPGAERDTYFKTGRVISALETDMSKSNTPKCRVEAANRYPPRVQTPYNAGSADTATTLPANAPPVRRIPP